jgi:hypothetical protein
VAQPTGDGVDRAAGWLARTVQADPAALARLGRQARQLAERQFDIGAIADRFENVLLAAVQRGGGEQSTAWRSDEEAAA